MFTGLGAGILVKILSFFGGTVLNGVLSYFQNKSIQDTAQQSIWAGAMIAALGTQIDAMKIASDERVALWGSLSYRILIWFIVGVPALYLNSILFVSIFHNLGWVVLAAPDIYANAALSIVLTFIGVTGGTHAIIGAVKEFRK